MVRCKHTSEIESDLTKTKKNSLSKALVVALKKYSKLFTIFPDFLQVWKIAGQISKFFQEFKTLYEP